jgi:hypothetical protein
MLITVYLMHLFLCVMSCVVHNIRVEAIRIYIYIIFCWQPWSGISEGDAHCDEGRHCHLGCSAM